MGWIPIAVTAWVLFSACIAVVVGRAIHLADQDRDRSMWPPTWAGDVVRFPTVARAGRGSGPGGPPPKPPTDRAR